MASAALLADQTYTDALSGCPVVERYFPTEAPRFVGDSPQMVRVPTGLAPDLSIETTLPANPIMVDVLLRLHELKALPQDWDSYGSSAVPENVFRPALQLIIEAVRRCAFPTIVPLPEGGLGLRWADQGKALELDVYANSSVEGFLEAERLETPIESEGLVSAEEAMQLLLQYCRM